MAAVDPLSVIGTDLTDPAPALQEPDFTSCDPEYGRDLLRTECLQAANKLPHGLIAWPYALRPTPGFDAPFKLPISLNMGQLIERSLVQAPQTFSNHLRRLPNLRRSSWAKSPTGIQCPSEPFAFISCNHNPEMRWDSAR